MKTIKSVYWYSWNSAVETSLSFWPLTTSNLQFYIKIWLTRPKYFLLLFIIHTLLSWKFNRKRKTCLFSPFSRQIEFANCWQGNAVLFILSLKKKGKQNTNVFDIFDYHLGTLLQMEQKSFKNIKLNFLFYWS